METCMQPAFRAVTVHLRNTAAWDFRQKSVLRLVSLLDKLCKVSRGSCSWKASVIAIKLDLQIVLVILKCLFLGMDKIADLRPNDKLESQHFKTLGVIKGCLMSSWVNVWVVIISWSSSVWEIMDMVCITAPVYCLQKLKGASPIWRHSGCRLLREVGQPASFILQRCCQHLWCSCVYANKYLDKWVALCWFYQWYLYLQ